MKKTIILFIVIALGTVAWADMSSRQIKVGVLEFVIKGDLGIKDAGQIIAEWLSASLAKDPQYEVLERVLLDKVLEEQSIQLSGIMDEDTSVKIGKFSAADQIVTGSLVKWKNTITLTARRLDVTSGAVLSTSTYKTKEEQSLSFMMDKIAFVLTGKVPQDSLDSKNMEVDGKTPENSAISVVRATQAGSGLRVIIDRGSSDKVLKGNTFAIMLPEYGRSEVSGQRVRTGMKLAGALTISYVEPNYSAGNLRPELFYPVTPKELESEAVAVAIPPTDTASALSYDIGAENSGGFLGMSVQGKLGIWSLSLGYEFGLPSLLLHEDGLILATGYTAIVGGNYLSTNYLGLGSQLFLDEDLTGKMIPGALFTNALGLDAFGEFSFNGFSLRAGARGYYAFDLDAKFGGSSYSYFQVEPYIRLCYGFKVVSDKKYLEAM